MLLLLSTAPSNVAAELGFDLDLTWGTAATADEGHLYLNWHGTAGKQYQVQRLDGEDFPTGIPWPVPAELVPWQDIGSPIAGYGAGIRVLGYILPDAPSGDAVHAGSLVPSLFVTVQSLTTGGVLVSWAGAAQIDAGEISSAAPPVASVATASYDLFCLVGGQVTPAPGVDLSTPLTTEQEGRWAEIQTVMGAILDGSVPPLTGTIDEGGEAADPPPDDGRSYARQWRVKEIWPDTDNDGLYDWQELNGTTTAPSWWSNPFLADSDGDGWNDHIEFLWGTSALNVAEFPSSSILRLTLAGDAVQQAPQPGAAMLPVRVRVTDSNANPVGGFPVTFSTESNGLALGDPPAAEQTVFSDAQGFAQIVPVSVAEPFEEPGLVTASLPSAPNTPPVHSAILPDGSGVGVGNGGGYVITIDVDSDTVIEVQHSQHFGLEEEPPYEFYGHPDSGMLEDASFSWASGETWQYKASEFHFLPYADAEQTMTKTLQFLVIQDDRSASSPITVLGSVTVVMIATGSSPTSAPTSSVEFITSGSNLPLEVLPNSSRMKLLPPEGIDGFISHYLLPVEIVVPDIDSEGFETGNLIAAQELKVGKMEHSLDGSHNINIEDDPDRFYIRIPETAGLENVSVKIATVENPDGGAYNDNETEVTLHAKGGRLESKSQLLVSDDVDDDHTANDVGADDAPEDRTHRVQLGGKVKIASISLNGTTQQMDWKLPVKVKKTVRLHVVRMADAGVTDQSVLDDIKLAKERFAQIGVQLIVESNQVKPVPTSEMSESSILLRIIGGGLSPGAKSLITNYGTPSFEDIHVFYCKETKDFEDLVAGFALTEASYPETPQFLNNIFVSAARKPYTLAHELGHILTNRGHAGEDYSVGVHEHQRDHNLMAPTSPTNTIGATKRLHQKQQNWIWQHRCAQ